MHAPDIRSTRPRRWRYALALAAIAAACRSAVSAIIPEPPPTPDPMVELEIFGPDSALTIGTTFKVRAVALDASAHLTTTPPMAWSSSKPSIATIDSAGVISAIAVGSTTIVGTAGNLVRTTPVTVAVSPVVRLELTGYAFPMSAGTQSRVSVTAFNAQGQSVGLPLATWSTTDPTVAAISTTGPASSIQLTALAPGTATITATFSGLTTQVLATVNPIPASAARVTLFPEGEFGDTIQLAPGQLLQLTGYASSEWWPYQLLQAAGAAVWTSSRTDVVTVNGSGVATAAGVGTALLTGTINIGSASAPSLVSAVRPIRVAPAAGAAVIRLVNLSDATPSLTMRSNAGAPIALPTGQLNTLSIPAGTFQINAAEFPPTAVTRCNGTFDCLWSGQFDFGQFTGFLGGGTRATFVAATTDYGFSLMPLWDFTDPVAADVVMIRVALVTISGYNVYVVPTGAAIGVPYLQGCYLDWPFGYTDYVQRPSGSFDIVLQPGKGVTAPESARFTVTPSPGHATTYVLSGSSSTSLKLTTLVDH